MPAAPDERQPKGARIHEQFEEQARRNPHRVAVACRGRELTYRELNRRANGVAQHILSLDLPGEALVGVALDRSLELVVALLGVLKAGAAYVPIDLEHPADRIVSILDDAGVRLLIARGNTLRWEGPHRNVLAIDAISAEVEENVDGGATSSSLAYVIYTSGSTGKPKGVAIEHGSLANVVSAIRSELGFGAEDTLLAVTSISFDIAALEIFLPLVAGGRLILAGDGVARDPAALGEAIERSGATVMQATPSTWRMLLLSGWRGQSEMRAFCGGEPLSTRLAAELLARVKSLTNLYGPTETTVWSTFDEIESVDGGITVGRAIANTRLYIVSQDAPGNALSAVAPGEVGELCIAGSGVARGYWNQPELTGEKFLLDPFVADGSRLYRTGDLARKRPDGRIELLGRMDRQLKIRGTRIEPEDVESVLARHPAVDECVVVGRPVANDSVHLVAYVVRKSRRAPEAPDAMTAEWRKVWSEVYRQAARRGEESVRTAGWHDSITELPMHDEELREWHRRTADRILALRPKRVLELGCGAGMLLRLVAPHVESYVGLDPTEEAVAEALGSLAREPIPGVHIDVRPGSADDLESFPAGAVDCIVLNSVVQYFPDVNYAVGVLRAAVRKLAPGGSVFVGDVRSLPLLEALHASIQLARSPESRPADELYQRIREAVHREKELVLDPGIFEALAKTIPEVEFVEVRPKRGRRRNELTRFRYDVVLGRALSSRPSSSVQEPTPSPRVEERVEWSDANLSIASLPAWLRAQTLDRVTLVGVPNVRVAGELAVVDALSRSRAPATVADVRILAAAAARGAVDPEEVCLAAEASGFQASLAWSSSPALVDVELARPSRESDTAAPKRSASVATESSPPPSLEQDWRGMATDPSRTRRGESLARSLRGYLRELLPEALVPARFVEVERLPRTLAGKLDEAALAALDVAHHVRQSVAVPPSDALELLLTEIWQDVLAVDGVGVNHPFVELGGDSLLAVEIMASLEKRLRRTMSMASVFGIPHLTIAKQAAVLRSQGFSPPESVSVAQLQSGDARSPLFFASMPMNVVRHMGKDQALYDINIPAVHEGAYVRDRLERSVEECVSAIRRIDPHGPYFLGGPCFSGLVMLETAKRLHAEGETVGLVAVINPEPDDDAALPLRIANRLRDLSRMMRTSPVVRNPGRALVRTVQSLVEGSPNPFDGYNSFYRSMWGESDWAYPFPVAVLITLPPLPLRKETLGRWERRRTPNLNVIRVPGTAATVYAEPHARVAADQIRRAVRWAQDRDAAPREWTSNVESRAR